MEGILYDTEGAPTCTGTADAPSRDYKRIQNGKAGAGIPTGDANYVHQKLCRGSSTFPEELGWALATTDLDTTLDKSTVKNIISQMVPNRWSSTCATASTRP